MKLEADCYTDICIKGKWFHYEHGGDTVYMLRGGCPPTFNLDNVPQTEEELEELLESIAISQCNR